jgi:hypothetical protein
MFAPMRPTPTKAILSGVVIMGLNMVWKATARQGKIPALPQ